VTDKAFILGNGLSRPTDIKWLNNLEGDTYGCNAIYRDFEPDFLVANDWAMMVEIINSTYSGNCQFTDYYELPMEAFEGMSSLPDFETAIHIGEQEVSNSFVFMGSSMGEFGPLQKNIYHIIWLDESLRHITWGLKPQFESMSTGLCALQLALETGYDEIDVIGFSGLKDRNYKNIYDGTKNYTFDPLVPDKIRVPETYVPRDASHWETVYMELVKQYPNTRVNLL